MIQLGETEDMGKIQSVGSYPKYEVMCVSESHRRHKAIYGMDSMHIFHGAYTNSLIEPPLAYPAENALFAVQPTAEEHRSDAVKQFLVGS